MEDRVTDLDWSVSVKTPGSPTSILRFLPEYCPWPWAHCFMGWLNQRTLATQSWYHQSQLIVEAYGDVGREREHPKWWGNGLFVIWWPWVRKRRNQIRCHPQDEDISTEHLKRGCTQNIERAPQTYTTINSLIQIRDSWLVRLFSGERHLSASLMNWARLSRFSGFFPQGPQLPQVVLWPAHVSHDMCTHAQKYVHINIWP